MEYLQSFDVFLFTPNQPDSLPTVLIHALGVGKPIISTRIGGIPEIIQDHETGILIDPDNINQLEIAMLAIIFDSQLRDYLGKRD